MRVEEMKHKEEERKMKIGKEKSICFEDKEEEK
jgi:hypothetical protein